MALLFALYYRLYALILVAVIVNGFKTMGNQLFSRVSKQSYTSILKSNSQNIDNFISTRNIVSSRIQKLKNVSLQKEVMKDITAAEFATRVEVKINSAKINYSALLLRLDKNLDILTKKGAGDNASLLSRIKSTKIDLITKLDSVKQSSSADFSIDGIQNTDITSNEKEEIDIAEGVKELRESLRVFVREDGSVDWDGAIASGREVAKFGAELWERLNGKDESEGLPSISEIFGQAQAKEPENKNTFKLQSLIFDAKANLSAAINIRDLLKTKLRQSKRDGTDISQNDLQQLRELDVRVKDLGKCMQLFLVDLDIERVCAYLQQELESSVEPSEQRIFIAEITLIDKQFSGIVPSGIPFLSSNAENTVSQSISTLLQQNLNTLSDVMSLIDDDELNLIISELNDLKGRLGLVTSSVTAMDWGSLGVVVTDGISKIKEGLTFYGDGTKILINDVIYGWKLLLRAVQGYTLKPREVNSVRRTGKDLLTLIPFTIILIIPLSPIGHVLVFSFIQRFFPDFFPSCYTEKRLNLRKLYSEIEYKDDEFLFLEDSQSPQYDLTKLTSFLNLPKWLSINNSSKKNDNSNI